MAGETGSYSTSGRSDESKPKTLYVGNLDASVTDELILALFGVIGPVKGCKIIHETGGDPYCFVEFADHNSAAAALAAMNKRLCLGKEMKVNWASTPSSAPKGDPSRAPAVLDHLLAGDFSTYPGHPLSGAPGHHHHHQIPTHHQAKLHQVEMLERGHHPHLIPVTTLMIPAHHPAPPPPHCAASPPAVPGGALHGTASHLHAAAAAAHAANPLLAAAAAAAAMSQHQQHQQHAHQVVKHDYAMNGGAMNGGMGMGAVNGGVPLAKSPNNNSPTASSNSSSSSVGSSSGSRPDGELTARRARSGEHYHIFVGDLSPDITTEALREAFAPFGEISDCRVVRDIQTLKSKGYGFVSFMKKADAEAAIAGMNGTWLGSRNIRTNWATRKPPQSKNENHKALTYEEVYNQASPSNCTVYVGGVTNGLTEELMNKTFSPYGTISEVRVFKDKGYAFIRFTTKESAAQAIVALHNTDINGQPVKCSWGKEASDASAVAAAASQALAGAQFPYSYGQQLGYWYNAAPQAYQLAAGGQFLQGMQAAGYPYGQFSYQQSMAPAMNNAAAAAAAAAALNPYGLQQAGPTMGTLAPTLATQSGMLGAYPVTQFQ